MFDADPQVFFAAAPVLLAHFATTRPSYTHFFLAVLAARRRLRRLFSQNVDGLERVAGVPRDDVVACHGTLATFSCRKPKCSHTVDTSEILPLVLAPSASKSAPRAVIRCGRPTGGAKRPASRPPQLPNPPAARPPGLAAASATTVCSSGISSGSSSSAVASGPATLEPSSRQANRADSSAPGPGRGQVPLATTASVKRESQRGQRRSTSPVLSAAEAAAVAKEEAGPWGFEGMVDPRKQRGAARSQRRSGSEARADAATAEAAGLLPRAGGGGGPGGRGGVVVTVTHAGGGPPGLPRVAVPASSPRSADGSAGPAASPSASPTPSLGPAGKAAAAGEPRRARECGGAMKPGIVFFGEELPAAYDSTVVQDLAAADLFVAMGTSMRVRPAGGMLECLRPGVPAILVNAEDLRTVSKGAFDLTLRGQSDVVCAALAGRIAGMGEAVDAAVEEAERARDSGPVSAEAATAPLQRAVGEPLPTAWAWTHGRAASRAAGSAAGAVAACSPPGDHPGDAAGGSSGGETPVAGAAAQRPGKRPREGGPASPEAGAAACGGVEPAKRPCTAPAPAPVAGPRRSGRVPKVRPQASAAVGLAQAAGRLQAALDAARRAVASSAAVVGRTADAAGASAVAAATSGARGAVCDVSLPRAS